MVIFCSLDQISLNESGTLSTVHVQMRWIWGFWAERMGCGTQFCFCYIVSLMVVVQRWALAATAPVPEFLEIPLFGIQSNIVWNNKKLGNHTEVKVITLQVHWAFFGMVPKWILVDIHQPGEETWQLTELSCILIEKIILNTSFLYML